MKIVIRYFFKTLRLLIGPPLLLGEWLTTPRGVVRTPEAQEKVNAETAKLALYQFRTCPFCIKVRKEIKRYSLEIELRDARGNAEHRQALKQGLGKIQVPCLRIEKGEGEVVWMEESAAINRYLQQRFGLLEEEK
ncbi:MAG: glutaredoxin [Gammaproteobacteria bacterium]|nr:glutaredoxin [Gammaproteobacteria bacterium]